MRVSIDGLIFKQSPNGGISRYWAELFAAMELLDANVRYNVALPLGVHYPIRARTARAGSLISYWNAWRADLFHSTYYTEWPRMRCPFVVTVYDFIDALLPQLRPNNFRFVQKQLVQVKRADAVIAISKETGNLVETLAGVERDKIFVAYPGVPAPFRSTLPSEQDITLFRQNQTGGAPYLLHVGKRDNYKNFRTILKAFCRIADKTDRHLLVVGGKHPLPEDEIDWMISSRLLNRIHFLPLVDDKTLHIAYAGADAMVHASLMEGFGIPVIEALASGTGLIISDIPVYREIAGSMATFVDPAEVGAWEEAFLQPVTVQHDWREKTLNRFSWCASASAHLDAYRSVLAD